MRHGAQRVAVGPVGDAVGGVVFDNIWSGYLATKKPSSPPTSVTTNVDVALPWRPCLRYLTLVLLEPCIALFKHVSIEMISQ